MRILRIISILTLLSFISCDRILDNYWEKKAEENYISPYKGVYEGTYSGSDQGTLRVEVSRKDFVEVSRTSTKETVTESFFGGLNGASFNQVQSRTSDFSLTGNLIYNQQNTYTGTWKMDEYNYGTYTLKKK